MGRPRYLWEAAPTSPNLTRALRFESIIIVYCCGLRERERERKAGKEAQIRHLAFFPRARHKVSLACSRAGWLQFGCHLPCASLHCALLSSSRATTVTVCTAVVGAYCTLYCTPGSNHLSSEQKAFKTKAKEKNRELGLGCTILMFFLSLPLTLSLALSLPPSLPLELSRP